MTQTQRQAFELLLSPSSQRAFDLGKEPPAVRDRYGRDLLGSSMLLARRLVEAGVTFVTVHTETKGARPLGHAREQLQHAAPAGCCRGSTAPCRRCSTTWRRAACWSRRW